jgi:hypothetical protein
MSNPKLSINSHFEWCNKNMVQAFKTMTKKSDQHYKEDKSSPQEA